MTMTEQLELDLDMGDEKPVSADQLEKMIPRPVGYHLLIAMPKASDTWGDSGIVKPSQTVQNETILSMVGLVLDMGAEAYSDESRFPNGPWCERGSYVIFRSNSGTRFKVQGQEYRLLNDDSIEAVVEDPNAVTHV